MRTDALDYDLPGDRIATHPADPRDSARLMVVRRDTGNVEHCHVRDLPTLGVLRAGDLMAVNQTRVLPAAFEAIRRATGGKVRGLYLPAADAQHDAATVEAMLESRGKLAPGEVLDIPEAGTLTLIESLGRGQWRMRWEGDGPFEQALARVGVTPLPPYIRKARRQHEQAEIQQSDADRYNTVYAEQLGSVAAPTAGLHFTPALLDAFSQRGVQRTAVTLHVGMGTFAPVRSEDLAAHEMHEEWIDISAKTIEQLRRTRTAGGRILAVGTTTVRALESLPQPLSTEGYTSQTRLFITPDIGFQFRFTDMLLTNFHLPRSTLLALVAALPGVGLEQLLAWYRIAIDEGYRFYSFGDAMLIV